MPTIGVMDEGRPEEPPKATAPPPLLTPTTVLPSATVSGAAKSSVPRFKNKAFVSVSSRYPGFFCDSPPPPSSSFLPMIQRYAAADA